MTDNTIRDNFTETEENPNLSKNQFFLDPVKGIDIGYAYDITTAGTPAKVVAALKAAGFGANLSTTEQTALFSTISSYAGIANPTQANVNALNGALGAKATISPSVAQALLDNYYTNNVDNVLPKQLTTYASLASTQVTELEANPCAWAALQDILYTAPSAISGSKIPNLDADISNAITTDNWGKVAYDIGFNPVTSAFNRREDESLLTLGFNAGGFAENLSTSLKPISSTSVNNQSVITYEQIVATGTLAPYDETQTAVFGYLATQGYYVPQPTDAINGTSASAIAALVVTQLSAISGIFISAQTLQNINSVFSDSNFSVGGIVHVPNAVLSVTTTPSALPTLAAGFTYVYDAATKAVYTVGASLDNSNSGMIIDDSNGIAISASLVTSLSDTTADSIFALGSNLQFGFDNSNDGFQLADGSGDTSTANINPVGGTIASLVDNGNGLAEAILAFNGSSLLPAVVASADGTYSIGSDPPDNFESVASFASDGLNGDTVMVSDNGTALAFEINIGAGATAVLASDYSLTGFSDQYDFTSSDGTLKLDDPSSFLGTISSFLPGDTIDLSGLTATNATVGAGNVLTVFDGNNAVASLSLDPNQTFTGEGFVFTPDSSGGTDLTVAAIDPAAAGSVSLAPGGDYVASSLPENYGYPSISWTGVVTSNYAGTSDNWSAYSGSMASVIATAAYGVPAFRNPVLSALDAPETYSSLGVGGPPQFAATSADDLEATKSISYSFSSAVPSTTSFLLWDPGSYDYYYTDGPNYQQDDDYEITYVYGPYTFDVSASLNGQPVSTAGFTFSIESPSYSSPGGSYSIDAASGEITVNSYTPYGFPDAVIVITPNTPIDAIEVSADTLYNDDWGLAVPTAIACFVSGTNISTSHGEQPVESLKIGDEVRTLVGKKSIIKWIGVRSYDGRFINGQHLTLPVCIKRDAIAGNVPARDLWVSPGHALYIDGMLVPAWRLINGVSITQAPSIGSVTYYHIELADHEIIFAEGCPTESFLNEDCRNQFQNSLEFAKLYPNDRDEWQLSCFPRIEQGFQLQAIQRRLDEKASIPATIAEPGFLRGFVDQAGPEVVSGWAQDVAQPEKPVCLDVLINGLRAVRILANHYRADLRAAGLGSGCHGFEAPLPANVAGQVEVRRSIDQAGLALTDVAARLRVA